MRDPQRRREAAGELLFLDMQSIIKVAASAALVAAGGLYLASTTSSPKAASAAALDEAKDDVAIAASLTAPPSANPPTSMGADSEVTKPEIPEPEYVSRMNRLHAMYGEGTGDAAELDAMWENSDPLTGDEAYAILRQELNDREAFLQTFLTSLQNSAVPRGPQAAGELTESEFYEMYSRHALEETAFLIERCEARSFRKAPFFPLPNSITTTSHPSAQLVSHFSPGLEASLVARLEQGVVPGLFHERITVGQMAETVMGASQSGVNSLRADTRSQLRDESR